MGPMITQMKMIFVYFKWKNFYNQNDTNDYFTNVFEKNN